MSASVSTESTYGRGVLDSLSALSDDITSSLASSESLSERQQIELVEVFTDLKNTLAHQVALLSNVVLREFRERGGPWRNYQNPRWSPQSLALTSLHSVFS